MLARLKRKRHERWTEAGCDEERRVLLSAGAEGALREGDEIGVVVGLEGDDVRHEPKWCVAFVDEEW
eukprot:1090052-Pleurochrysis_carterae.AAC.2